MGADWISTRIGDVAAPVRNALVGGPFGSDLLSSDYVPSGVPVIRGENLGSGRWVGGAFVFVSDEKAERLRANCASPGDVIFTQRGANHYRQIAVVPDSGHERYLISQSQMKITVDRTKALPLFLYYWFRTEQQQDYLRRHAIATGVPHTNLGILRDAPIRLPSLAEQRQIIAVLGSLDDKIELNRRMCETLAAIARALFKAWFVDFSAVRTRTRFVDSPAGSIPDGWTVRKLGDFVTLQRGTTYKSSLLGDKGPILLGLATIRRDGGFRSDSLRTYGGHSPPKLLLSPGDMFVSLKDVTQAGDLLGAVARVPPSVERGRLTQDTVKLEVAPGPTSTEFLYWLLRSERYREYCRVHAMGTTNLSLSRQDFLDYPFAMPPPAIQRAVFPTLEALGRRCDDYREAATLASIRDALLPRLMSGALRTASLGQSDTAAPTIAEGRR